MKNGFQLCELRFNSDGTVDKSFGNEGKVITNVGYAERVEAISLQNDGKILISGYLFEINDDDTAFAIRYNANGTIDSSYATNGVFEFTLFGIDFLIAGHATDQEENIYIAGKYFISLSLTVFVLKVNTDGVLDKSFGVDGEAIYLDAISTLRSMGLNLMEKLYSQELKLI